MNLNDFYQWLHPRYWLLWPILMLSWLVTFLPMKVLLPLGRSVGWVFFRFAKKARNIASANLRHCFTRLSQNEQDKLLQLSFSEFGISLVETMVVWFRPLDVFYRKYVTVEGMENLDHALAQEKGIILLSCHYGSLDLNAALMKYVINGRRPYNITYRKTSDVVASTLSTGFRKQYCEDLISVMDMRSFVKALKKKRIVWYAPDIELKRKNTLFADFFDMPASTNIAISRLADMGDAIVVPYAHYRVSNSPEYKIKIFPALDSIPSDDYAKDARTVNQVFEQIIAPFPERYWWVIKRFKVRPPGEKSIY